MADPVYQKCGVCGEMTKHTWDAVPLCRDGRCREIVLGREAAATDTHLYLTEPQSKEQP